MQQDRNIDPKVVDDFGYEWSKYNYIDDKLEDFLNKQFNDYFKLIDLTKYLNTESVGCDFGAGSGRWAEKVLKNFKNLYVLEPSNGAQNVLKNKFHLYKNVILLNESIGNNSIPNETLDFAYSLGVIHHLPDAQRAMIEISKKLKPGAEFLCYMYYNLENKSWFYRFVFKCSNLIRLGVSKLPQRIKWLVSSLIAVIVYFPLARFSKLLFKLKINISNFPLYQYHNKPLEVMLNDALDRFGTRLENRFSVEQITKLLNDADFDISTLKFSDSEPYYTFRVCKNQSK